ncbi:hypothetical protein X798_00729 [Onchocerca flexuosa]|uniref:Uncharacterized protein n=1 Tax=Onchocerca flexuosa TaxID=387005 RepID=A0A238C5I8_9BILA|nr:hypothetical protein X798_00729 [Onchocerca flexuosa]
MSFTVSNNSLSETTRLRIKEPVYTSDKRAKFTQRESKKWIRFCTVIGYIFFVSLPATSLSIYYIWIWNPEYINRFPPAKNRTMKMDYTVKPISLARQDDQPRSLKENNIGIKIGKGLIRASTHQNSLTRTSEGFLRRRPLKVSHKISQQQMESLNIADQRLKIQPNQL